MEFYCKVPHKDEVRALALVQAKYQEIRSEFMVRDLSYNVKHCKRNSIIKLKILPFVGQQETLMNLLTPLLTDVGRPYNNSQRYWIWIAYHEKAGYTKGKYKKLLFQDLY